MQINGNSGNNINFIEQRKSVNALDVKKDITNSLKSDELSLSSAISPSTLIQTNESITMLQVAFESIEKLEMSGEKLQKFSEPNIEFEAITESMLDIVDNTVFKETQLFFTNLSFSTGSSSLELSLSKDYGIEDLSVNNTDGFENFKGVLSQVKEEIQTIKQHLETASFNKIASLSTAKPSELLLNKSSEEVALHVKDMSKAHNIDALKDKISTLLD